MVGWDNKVLQIATRIRSDTQTWWGSGYTRTRLWSKTSQPGYFSYTGHMRSHWNTLIITTWTDQLALATTICRHQENKTCSSQTFQLGFCGNFLMQPTTSPQISLEISLLARALKTVAHDEGIDTPTPRLMRKVGRCRGLAGPWCVRVTTVVSSARTGPTEPNMEGAKQIEFVLHLVSDHLFTALIFSFPIPTPYYRVRISFHRLNRRTALIIITIHYVPVVHACSSTRARLK